MKKITSSIVLAFSVLFFLNSCSVNHSIQEDDLIHFKQNDDNAGASFVRFKDGHVLHCQTLIFKKKGFLTTPYLLADGWYKIKANDVERYQIDGKLAVSGTNIKDELNSVVAKDALPGFAVRLVSGKMNVYQRIIFNGRSAFTRYYIQLGTTGPIVKYSPEALKKMFDEQTPMKFISHPPSKSLEMIAYLKDLSYQIDAVRFATLN